MEQKDDSPLELVLESDTHQVPLTEPVRLRVHLRNRGNRAVTVNGRLLLNRPTAPDSEREIGLLISGPPGYINLKRFHVNAGPARPDQFVQLQPGASIQREYDLGHYFSLHMVGTYTIKATYTNRIPVRIDNENSWIGVLTSEAVTIDRM